MLVVSNLDPNTVCIIIIYTHIHDTLIYDDIDVYINREVK